MQPRLRRNNHCSASARGSLLAVQVVLKPAIAAVRNLVFLWPLACLALTGCHKETPAADATNPAAGGNPATAPVDYLGAIAKGKITAETTVETASINQAVQLFLAQEGRFPKDLNELVGPNYLSKLPEPPAGKKFVYIPANGEVKVVPK
jgi:hypothetical protein